MKNILITGANGLLGSEFKARLTDEEPGSADMRIWILPILKPCAVS